MRNTLNIRPKKRGNVQIYAAILQLYVSGYSCSLVLGGRFIYAKLDSRWHPYKQRFAVTTPRKRLAQRG